MSYETVDLRGYRVREPRASEMQAIAAAEVAGVQEMIWLAHCCTYRQGGSVDQAADRVWASAAAAGEAQWSTVRACAETALRLAGALDSDETVAKNLGGDAGGTR